MAYPTIDGALCCQTDYGILTFNPGSGAPGQIETVMHTPAWCCIDVTPLWMTAQQRGQNVIIPTAIGTRAYKKRKHETEYSLPMVISGAVDQDNVPWPNRLEGLRQNIAWLNENVVDPPPLPAVTRTATLLSPDGFTVLEAEVQVLELERGSELTDEIVTEAVLHILIPAGNFAEPVS